MLHRTIAAEEVAKACRNANVLYGFDVEPVVDWKLRGLAAGRAYYSGFRISLNEHIARNEGEAFRQTVGHEVAHLVTYWRHMKSERGRLRYPCPAAHGWEWKSVMLALGYRPDRCHSYASAARVRNVRRYAYVCRCGMPHSLTARAHGVQQAADEHLSWAGYTCRRCRTRLQFVEEA